MYRHENLHKSISANKLNDLTLIEIKGQPVKHYKAANSQTVLWEPVFIFMGLVILCSLVPKIGGKVRNGFGKNLKSQPKSPCTKCKFFSNNPYLKCAAQPSLVLTEQAKDCPDCRLEE